MKLLNKTIKNIGKLDEEMMEKAQLRLDNLTKPPGSLGRLEDIAVKLAGISGQLYPDVTNKQHIVMAADHGVVAEGVSAFPQAVTMQMVYNFLNGGAAINVLAKQAGAGVTIVDMGVADAIDAEGLVDKKIKPGTNNIARGPAMNRKQAAASLEAGISVVNDLIKEGADVIGTGEMGIGNTTASSAILAVVSGLPLADIVGRGTGIKDEQLQHKIKIISRALAVNKPDIDDGLDILSKVGGLEIGGMAGVMLGAAAARVPVMIDGLISGAAALIAWKLNPAVTSFMIPSHKSVEPGHVNIYQLLGLEPLLDLKMRLGEGTGAVLAMNLVEAAASIIKEMATFAEAKISE